MTPFLRLYRALSGKTQREVAGEAGVSPAFVSQLETGRRDARPSTIGALAEAVFVEPDDLVRVPGPDEHPQGHEDELALGGPPPAAPRVGETVVLRRPTAAEEGTVKKIEYDDVTGRTRLLLDGEEFPFPVWTDLLYATRKEVKTP